MKTLTFLIFLLANLPIYAQTIALHSGNTRAVVIGISEYAESAIADLKYAHIDAKAFVNWLKSPAGGSLEESRIKLLTNEEATTGKMISALDWLMEQSKNGDQAIIYFSGHSDVERITKFQRGYLLSHDSPSKLYVAGAFSLVFLQDVISTLSYNGVQVMMIADACRAGNLAGNDIKGAQLTTSHLAQRFANEIKILSSQPDEYSHEGEQWGGGRGCFSYHLLEGLYGRADHNADLQVSLMEIEHYLQDLVPKETAPLSQIPMAIGNPKTTMAWVNKEHLDALNAKKLNQLSEFKPTKLKGAEVILSENVRPRIREAYAGFLKALSRGNLLPTQSNQKSADEYYTLLINEPEIAEWHGVLKRDFASALMDESQKLVNLFLKTDPMFTDNIWAMPIHLDHAPEYLHRAAELLGEEHYIYNSLKAKEFYFKGKSFRKENYPTTPLDSLASIQNNLYLEGLKYQPESPYILQALLFDNAWNLVPDSLAKYMQELEHITPNWAMGQYTLGHYSNKIGAYEESIRHYQEAIKIDSSFLSSYAAIASPYAYLGKQKEANHWRSLFVQKLQNKIDSDKNFATASLYNDLGNALWRLDRLEEAEQVLLIGEEKSGGQLAAIYATLGLVSCGLKKYENAIAAYHKHFEIVGHASFDYVEIGRIYHIYLKNFAEAERAYLKAIEFNQSGFYNTLAKFSLGELYLEIGKKETAYQLFHSVLESLSPNEHPFHFNFTGRTFVRLGKMKNLRKTIQQGIKANPDNIQFYYQAGCIYAIAKKKRKAISWLEKTIKRGYLNYGYIQKDEDWDLVRNSKQFKALMKKYFPDQHKK